MKIGEYIELVKQAEIVDPTQNNATAIPLSTNGLPADVGEVTRGMLNNAPQSKPVQQGTPTSTSTSSYNNPTEGNFFRNIDPKTGLLRHPDAPTLQNLFKRNIQFGRLDGKPGIFSRIHPDLNFLEGVYIRPPYEYVKGQRVRNFLKSIPNSPAEIFNSGVNAPVRLADTSLMGPAFAFALPLSEAKDRIRADTYDHMLAEGYTPSENVPLTNIRPFSWFGYDISPDKDTNRFYDPALGREIPKQVINMGAEYASFSNPLFPINITTDLLINTPYQLVSGDPEPLLAGGLRHADSDALRLRTDEDYARDTAELEQLGELMPNVLKENDRRYRTQNAVAEIAANYIDPALQWPFGLLYGHNMSQLAKLMGRPNTVSYDDFGRAKVDYRDLFSPILGSKGSYEQNGGRPELRYMSENTKYWAIDKLVEAAAKNGYTRGEIEKAIELYTDPHSLLYKGANLLQLMAMSPEDVYGSVYMTDMAPEPEFMGQKTIRRYAPGYMNGGTFYEDETPEWTRAKDVRARQLADQETLFKMMPFFKAIKGSKDQLSDDERAFLDNPENITELWNIPVENVVRQLFEDELPNSDKQKRLKEKIERLNNQLSNYLVNDDHRKGLLRQREQVKRDYKLLRENYEEANTLNQIARLPYQYRYAFLQQFPEYIEPFLGRYYTNEDTKNKIKAFLGVPVVETAE